MMFFSLYRISSFPIKHIKMEEQEKSKQQNNSHHIQHVSPHIIYLKSEFKPAFRPCFLKKSGVALKDKMKAEMNRNCSTNTSLQWTLL